MSKEEAIELLSQIMDALLASNSWLPSTDNPIKEAFGMAISALQAQESCNNLATDTISRQAAIDESVGYIIEYCGAAFDEKMQIELIHRMENLPSADRWIPCSERLPEEHEWLGTKKFGTTISDEVYVTFENPKGERFCRHLSFQNGKLSASDQSTIDAFFKGSRPIAWMPLPEPWKGADDDRA